MDALPYHSYSSLRMRDTDVIVFTNYNDVIWFMLISYRFILERLTDPAERLSPFPSIYKISYSSPPSLFLSIATRRSFHRFPDPGTQILSSGSFRSPSTPPEPVASTTASSTSTQGATVPSGGNQNDSPTCKHICLSFTTTNETPTATKCTKSL